MQVMLFTFSLFAEPLGIWGIAVMNSMSYIDKNKLNTINEC